MRILHTSDWHLGKRLNQFSRIEEQRQVLDEIVEIADRQTVDLVVITGDLFDSFVPPVEAQELFYATLKRLSLNGRRPVIAIAGNHDSADTIQAPDPLARLHGIVLAGYPNLQLPGFTTDGNVRIEFPHRGLLRLIFPDDETPPVHIIVTPYANERRFFQIFRDLEKPDGADQDVVQQLTLFWKRAAESHFSSGSVNILLGHMFCISSGSDGDENDTQTSELIEPEDEKPILYPGGLPPVPAGCFPAGTQYAALGHLHRKQRVMHDPFPVWYPGSPLAYSKSEAEQKKYVLCVDLEPGTEAIVHEVELRSGRSILRPRVRGVENALDWLKKNQEPFVEMTIELDTYLSSKDRRRLYEAHPRLLTLVPELASVVQEEEGAHIDINRPIQELFGAYFAAKYGGSSPPRDLVGLFNEVLAGQEEGEDAEEAEPGREPEPEEEGLGAEEKDGGLNGEAGV
ncbi:MAG: exonuclease subunit SbcD [Spirochaetota bacterium]|nr:exonuclease subunit SbcD [Spirochaetota bacterium]